MSLWQICAQIPQRGCQRQVPSSALLSTVSARLTAFALIRKIGYIVAASLRGQSV